ncbi:zeta toxin family protein [Streptomyces sp. N2-109]|uniref:Zeta toxin family protein n=1 Tax=Streptomyces gossypii TaxID=2883101 RepID=A0ABT2JTV4_9ACTN|nr:zeta toxin family protein [Streptomyces gossypii]MCT2590914.1 zeta toxin family protein [Streptomyces gossypii]
MPAPILWINGPFGGGKTQTAHELLRRLPGSVVSDPEHLGFGLHRMLPRTSRGDFQDWPLWRRGVREVLSRVAYEQTGPVIVPMTLTDPGYFEEIIGTLRRDGHDVRHFALLADRRTVVRRIRNRGPRRDSWALGKVDHCLSTLARPEFAHHLSTESRTVPQVAEAVAASAGLRLTPNADGPARHWLRRARVSLRHVRFD